MSRRKFKDDELAKRSYETIIRASDGDNGEIEGVPIVFDKPTVIKDWSGEYTEIIDRHALDEADMTDVCLFVNHNTRKIALARAKKNVANSTMTLEIKDDGLHMNASLDIENNAEARAVYSSVKRQDVDGMSFMFRIQEQEWKDLDTDHPTRIIKKISIVHEVSVVNWPAYPQTSVSARSEETEHSPLEDARQKHRALEIKRKRIQIALEKTGGYSK